MIETRRNHFMIAAKFYVAVWLMLMVSGCQGVRHWWRNDMMVGPNYCEPPVPVATEYADADSPKINRDFSMDARWWSVFQDPELDQLIEQVYRQNLSLKAATWRIEESRAQRNIAAANLFPQRQTASAQYAHTQNSLNSATVFPGFPLTIDDWSVGFDASWEIDLWGRIRRSVRAADAQWVASIKDYDFALVTLIGDVASLYIQIRSLDERLELANRNVQLQEGSLGIAAKRFEAGRTSKLDVIQGRSNLAATKSLIPQLELARRQSLNALAVLVGLPASESEMLLPTTGRIPEVPYEVLVGIPAELVRQRPDIRSAERLMAAQFEQIGIAKADLLPTFAFTGTLGYQAAQLSNLFESASFTGTAAPGFQWNILNYGRLRNNIRVQEARVNQIRFDFENTVLGAQREVEDAIVEFIKSSEQFEYDDDNAEANREAVELALASYKEGKVDFGRVFVVQTNLVTAQDKLVTTKAAIALAVVKTYKALGGGWQIRCEGFEPYAVSAVTPGTIESDGLIKTLASSVVGPEMLNERTESSSIGGLTRTSRDQSSVRLAPADVTTDSYSQPTIAQDLRGARPGGVDAERSAATKTQIQR